MSLEVLLSDKKAAVVEKWFDLLLGDYPPETARFLKEEKDQFLNPIGNAFWRGLQGLYEVLLDDGDGQRATALLEDIMRIRAVQDLRPSRAVAFVLDLKRLLRDELVRETQAGQVAPGELSQLESRIDDLALLAFDLYQECRERIHEARLREFKNRTYRLLERANLVLCERTSTCPGETEG